MLLIDELRAIAQARLKDATVLFDGERPDGALYLCGYAVELALKARICAMLNWSGFPQKRSEFEYFTSFRTHKLDVLLKLSGQEGRIKKDYLDEWSSVVKWDPEVRYRTEGSTNQLEVVLMLIAAETLLEVLWTS